MTNDNEIVTLETYVTEEDWDESKVHNYEEFADNHIVVFKVNLDDFKKYINEEWVDLSFDEVLKDWTWDDCLGMPEDLDCLGILISREVVKR